MKSRLPIVELVLSRVFLHLVVRLSPRDISRLLRISGPLRHRWVRTRSQALRLISSCCGDKWREQNIRVYLVPRTAPFPSISDPLLLKVRDDLDVTFFTLVHELVHRFLQRSLRFKGPMTRVKREEREAIVNLAAERVCNRIIGPGRTVKAFEKYTFIVTSVNMDRVGELMMLLRKKWDPTKSLSDAFKLLV